jgi:hypothetical protein
MEHNEEPTIVERMLNMAIDQGEKIDKAITSFSYGREAFKKALMTLSKEELVDLLIDLYKETK